MVALLSFDGAHGRPMPDQEGIHILSEDSAFYYYGFLSLGAYADWFGAQSRMALEEEGFLLSLYHCHRDLVRIGYTQCAFHRPKARYISAFLPTFLAPVPEYLQLAQRPLWVDADTPHTGVY